MRRRRASSRRVLSTVVKVQVPLASNLLEPPLLVYNEDRTVMINVAMTSSLREKLTVDGELVMKAYYEARVLYGQLPGEVRLELGRRVAARGW